jgi:hypothetical protein
MAGPQPDIQIQADPSEWNKAFGPNVFTLYNTAASQASIYYFEIWNYNLTEKLATMRQNRNSAGVCHFDVKKILQNQVEPQRGLEATALLATSGPETLEYKVKAGYISTTDIPIITFESSTSYKLTMGRKPFFELDWDETPYIGQYTAVGSGLHSIIEPAQLLTDWDYAVPKASLTGTVPSEFANAAYSDAYVRRIRRDEQWTISAINQADISDGSTEVISQLRVKSYNGTTLVDDITIDNTEANGGGPLRVDACNYAAVVAPFLIITAQVGPDMLGLSADITHYYCWFEVSNPVSLIGCTDLAPTTGINRFDIDLGECNDFTPIQLSWMNSLGFRDYFTFQKRNDNEITIKRNEYYELPGDWNAGTFAIGQEARGRRVFSQSAEETWVLRTGYLTDQEAEFVKSLLLSADVNYHEVLANDATWFAATLTTARWQAKTFRKNKLFQLEIEIKVSNNVTTQRG